MHLDGDREDARQLGLPGRRLRPRGGGDRARPKARGFRTIINATLFDGAEPERVAKFFDDVMAMGVDGIIDLARLCL